MPRLRQEDKAGLYVTVTVHLAVILVLLVLKTGALLRERESFLLDFSQDRDMAESRSEKESGEDSFDEAIARKIADMLAGESGTEFRNLVTDRGQLKDDRGTDADKLYEEARRLSQELRDGLAADEADEDYAPAAKDNTAEKSIAEYHGPSVVSYSLDGRKASKMPIPAYKCFRGGMVTVLIIVDNQGRVIDAKIQDDVSSDDSCLRSCALQAARLSRFSTDPKAEPRQHGDIIYQFLAQ